VDSPQKQAKAHTPQGIEEFFVKNREKRGLKTKKIEKILGIALE
jgi:hypothetical protein